MVPLPKRVLRPAGPALLLLAAGVLPAGAADVASTHEDLLRGCLQAGRVQAVEPCTRALAALPPGSGDGLAAERQLAWSLLATYRETDAIERFAAIAARRPDDLRAQLDLAEVLVGLRSYDAAEAPLARARALAPDDVEVNRLAALFFTIREDYGAAHRAQRRLAAAGLLTAMFDLAEDYAQGRGVEPDQGEARRWLEAAAGGGHVLAMRTLSEKLRYGAFGTAPEPERADYWGRQAEALQVHR